MYEAFLFDLDGTLIRMKLDFARMRQGLTAIIGSVDGSILESVETFPDKALRARAVEYICTEERKAANSSEILRGSKECLEYLKERNIKIGIITRNNRESTILSLERAKIIDYADIILAREDVERVKPDPSHVEIALRNLGTEPGKSVVVGDHHFEIEAGNALGSLTVGLLSGSGTKETLKNADLLFNSIQEFYERWVLCRIK